MNLSDRCRGVLVGCAVGDALGTPVKNFKGQPANHYMTDMESGALLAGACLADKRFAPAILKHKVSIPILKFAAPR